MFFSQLDRNHGENQITASQKSHEEKKFTCKVFDSCRKKVSSAIHFRLLNFSTFVTLVATEKAASSVESYSEQ